MGQSRRGRVGATRRWVMWAVTVGVGATGLLGSPALGGPDSPTALGPLVPAQLARLGLHRSPGGMLPPEFSLRTLEGQTVSLTALRGQVVLLNFWATWCLDCRQELPALESLHRRFGPRGLAVVGINTREGPIAVRGYVRDLVLTFPLPLDSDGTITRAYGWIGLPTTFLVARDGRSAALAVGARDWASAAAVEIVEALLAAAPGAPGQPGR